MNICEGSERQLTLMGNVRVVCVCRAELETIRTMADQVRRRERGKKRELLLVRDERRRRARLAPDGTNDEAGPSEPGAPGGLPAVLPPDREARLATKAAAKVAREAATLVTAQVMLDPSGPNDRAPSAEPSSAAASRQAEKKESLHKPGEHLSLLSRVGVLILVRPCTR